MFPEEKIQSFWIENVLIPLEIIFINTEGRINEIMIMNPCAPDISTCPTYTSKSPARFAIKVNGDFTTKNLIIEGDILEVSGF